MKNIENKLTKILKKIRKPTLIMTLHKVRAENAECKSYFGGIPYKLNEIDKNKLICPECERVKKFAFQFIEIDKQHQSFLFRFFFCPICSEEELSLNYYLDKIELNDHEAHEAVDFEAIKNELANEVLWLKSKYAIDIFPAYDFPEWEYLNEYNEEVVYQLDEFSDGRTFEAYCNFIESMDRQFGKTGLKYKGYAEAIYPEEIPLDKYGNRMKLLFELDSIPDLGITWGSGSATLYIFYSETTGEYEVLILGINEVEDVVY